LAEKGVSQLLMSELPGRLLAVRLPGSTGRRIDRIHSDGEAANTFFHRGSVQFQNFGDAAVSVTLVAASQVPDDWDPKISAQSENQAVALPHVFIRHPI